MNERRICHCACGDHVFAALTRGYMTLVSPEDAGLLEAFSFCARIGAKNYAYAATSPMRKDGGYLHRLIMGASAGQYVDHVSGDKMDNRRSNLRFCTLAENQQNRRSLRRDLPKGVTKDNGLFRAQISVNGRKINLGRYPTPDEAHAVYVTAARKHFGEFARAA